MLLREEGCKNGIWKIISRKQQYAELIVHIWIQIRGQSRLFRRQDLHMLLALWLNQEGEMHQVLRLQGYQSERYGCIRNSDLK